MIFKTLILFFSMVVNLEQAVATPVCPEIKTQYNVRPVSTNTNTIQFEITGGSAPYSIIFFDSKGKLMSQDFSGSTFEQIAGGTYQCLVVDQNKCSSIINVIIP